MEKVNLRDKLAPFADLWSPKIVRAAVLLAHRTPAGIAARRRGRTAASGRGQPC